ncbi:nitrilase-related carbon-nitrogen hydrolase [Streptomyces sp. NPDC053542]|uniref:nitrilase-related carbon-nitrogen hydrolase n=1 Tax=Streptomyces sp. NPDC053542 TaxID=3365710 RepID=UPI0037D586C5
MKIATAQCTCVPAAVSANVEHMAALIAEARMREAESVVFPEPALTGYELAAVLRAGGVAGVVNCAAATDEDRPAIETPVFGADGEMITTYRKQYLFEHERDVFVAGQVEAVQGWGRLRPRAVRPRR